MKTIAVLLGTRPEIIKLWPVVSALQQSKVFRPYVVSTGQHRELANVVLENLGLSIDHDLKLMENDQSPATFLSSAVAALERELRKHSPVGVLVQGDTTTAMAGAAAAFYLRIPAGHVEAGLRTHDLSAPFPEEMHRRVVSVLAGLHFCPTERAAANLKEEGVSSGVHVVGNTVVDAALAIARELEVQATLPDPALEKVFSKGSPVVFVTGHRRENFDAPLQVLCAALRSLAERNPTLEIVLPVHLNPRVWNKIHFELENIPRIHLVPPLDYPSSIFAVRSSALIITDSGGIQEEAPSFGTPIIVVRRSTERPEAVESGLAKLVNLDDPSALVAEAEKLLAGGRLSGIKNPFGDGKSAGRIVEILEREWG